MFKPVVIYGNSTLCKMVFFDAMNDADFQIVGFVVDEEYWESDTLLGLPCAKFSLLEERFPKDSYDLLAVLGGYSSVRKREIYFNKAKGIGYKLRNYVSKKADVLPGTQMGENNIVIGYTHVGFDGHMGNNNIIRQNVYLGHDFQMGSHTTISPGCTFGGACKIGNLCYIGLGATVLNEIAIAEESLIGAGATVTKNTEPCSKNIGTPSKIVGYHHKEGIRIGGGDG